MLSDIIPNCQAIRLVMSHALLVYVPIIWQLIYHLVSEIWTQLPHLSTSGLIIQNQNLSKCPSLVICFSQLLHIWNTIYIDGGVWKFLVSKYTLLTCDLLIIIQSSFLEFIKTYHPSKCRGWHRFLKFRYFYNTSLNLSIKTCITQNYITSQKREDKSFFSATVY